MAIGISGNTSERLKILEFFPIAQMIAKIPKAIYNSFSNIFNI